MIKLWAYFAKCSFHLVQQLWAAVFIGLCGAESVLAALPMCEDAPATSQGVRGRNVLLYLSYKDVAGKRGLRGTLFGRLHMTSAAP